MVWLCSTKDYTKEVRYVNLSYQHVYAQVRWEIHSLPRTLLQSWHPEVPNATSSLWVAGLCQGNRFWIRAVGVEVEPAAKFTATVYFRRAVPENWLPSSWVNAQPNALPHRNGYENCGCAMCTYINLSISYQCLHQQMECTVGVPAKQQLNLQSGCRAQTAPVGTQGVIISFQRTLKHTSLHAQ